MVPALISLAGEAAKAPEKIALPKTESETTHFIAVELMDGIRDVLHWFGAAHNTGLANVLYVIAICAIGFIIGAIVKKLLLWIIALLGKKVHSDVFTNLRKIRLFTKLSRIIPPLFIVAMLVYAIVKRDILVYVLMRACWVYIIVIVGITLNDCIYAVWLLIDERENKRKLPLKGLVQLVKGIVWIVVAIVVVAIIVNRSPATLLAGIGAFAAVLMLIFKDSILGVVAGVQLSENDMLRVGDWIKINGTDANGTVQEVSLTSVKVLNWDKTVTTVPPYSLVSGSFTNYRTMQESGTRRIQRVYAIDADSVMLTTDAMLEDLKKIKLLEPFITQKQKQRAEGKVENVNNSAGLVNGTIDTNLGLFRAYMEMYIADNPNIDPNSTHFVTTLQQTSSGIPLQLYCFTNTSSWLPYEAIQAEIFEHMAVMLGYFRLYVFEESTGRDELINGYLEKGGDPADVLGMPHPFYAPDGAKANAPLATD